MAVWRFGLKDEIRLQPEGTRVDRYAPHRGRQLAQPGRFAPQIRLLGSAICSVRKTDLPISEQTAFSNRHMVIPLLCINFFPEAGTDHLDMITLNQTIPKMKYPVLYSEGDLRNSYDIHSKS